ncbi:MAG: hypothetical protein R3208_13250 [Ketobacteraceae bacterium]|nr:hypothetical protein [Ketobacteraceae bacterium]
MNSTISRAKSLFSTSNAFLRSILLLPVFMLASAGYPAGDGQDLLLVNNGDGSDFVISEYDRCQGCDPLSSPDMISAMFNDTGAQDYQSPDDPGTSEGNHCDDTHCNCAWLGCNNFAQQCAGYGYTEIACVTTVTKDGYPVGFGCECSGPSR